MAKSTEQVQTGGRPRGAGRRHVVAGLTILLGVGVSAWLFLTMRQSAHVGMQDAFARRSERRAAIIQRELMIGLYEVESLGALYAASREVEKDEFKRFAKHMLAQETGILGVAWAPRVSAKQRPSFEAAARELWKDENPNFQITERQAQGRMVPAAPRDVYFPVYFVEPLKPGKAPLGFDMASEPTRLAALTAARKTGKLAATGRITLVLESTLGTDFLVFLPIYPRVSAVRSGRPDSKDPEGFIVGVLRIKNIVDQALTYLCPAGIDIRVEDADAPAGKRFLYQHLSRQRRRTSATDPDILTDSDVRYDARLNVAGRNWQLHFTPTTGYLATATTYRPWVVLAVGVLLTGLLASYLASAVGRAERVQRMVRQRTAELERTNKALAGEIAMRKSAERALRESEQKYRTLTENTNDILYSVNSEGAFTYIGPQVQQYGFQPEEVISRNFSQFVAPEDRDKVNLDFRKTMSTGEEFPTEFRLADSQGRGHWLEDRGKVQRDETGRIVGMTGVLRNITERKHAEDALQEARENLQKRVEERTAELARANEELRRRIQERDRASEELRDSEKRYRELVEMMSEGFSTIDENTVLTYVNQAFCDMLGYSSDELLGRSTMDLHDQANQELLRQRLDDRRKGDATAHEIAFTRKDGKQVYGIVSPRALFDSDGRYRGSAAAITDITERREVERALRESERRYRAVVQDQTELICRYLPDGTLGFVNRAYCQYFDKRPDELLGTLFRPRIPREDWELVAEGTAVLSAEKPVITHEHRVVRPDGSIAWQQWTNRLVFDEQGRFTEVQSVGRDITERVRAEQELRKSEEQYRNLFENAVLGVYRTTPDGRILMANPAAVRMLGYSSFEEFAQRDLEDPGQYSPDYPRSRFRELMEKDGQVVALESAWIRKDGATLFVAENAKAFYDEDGKIAYYEGTVEDITERRKAEEALQTSVRQWNETFNAMEDPVCLVDPNGRLLRCNTTMARLLGKSPEQMLGQVCSQLVHCTPEPIKDCPLVRMRRTQRRETLAMQLGDRWFNVTVDPLFDEAGELTGGVHIMSDITERKWAQEALQRAHDELEERVEERTAELAKANEELRNEISERERAEAALRESEEKYRVLVESAGEAITTVDAGGTFLFLNTTAAQRLGGKPQDYVGKTMWDLFPKEIADRQAATVRRVIETGEPATDEAPTALRGEPRWYRTSLEPIRGGRGDIHAALIIARDITERREAEEALRAAHNKLMNAREEERRYLAGELHDSISQGLVALQLSMTPATDAAQDRLPEDVAGAVKQSVTKCADLIREVRQICYGLYPPTLDSLGLVAGMRQLADYCKSAGVSAAVKCTPTAEAGRFARDIEIALFRTAQEAVNNMLRHSEAKSVELKLKYKDQRVSLMVTDDGKGFDPDSAAGSGLGFPMMKERAQAINGQLEVSSRPGRTRITISAKARLERAGQDQDR